MAKTDGPPGRSANGTGPIDRLTAAAERAESPAVVDPPERRQMRRGQAATSAPAQLPAAPAAAATTAADGSQGGSRRGSRPRSAPAGGAGSAGSSKQAAGPAAAAGRAGAAAGNVAADGAAAAAAGDAEQPDPAGGDRTTCGGWQRDGKGWWRRTLAASASLHDCHARLSFPRELFKELTGRLPADKDQLDVVGAGRKQYSFQYRTNKQNTELRGAQLGSWAADTGAREGEEIALRGLSSGEVHVQCIPASTAAGAKAAGSLSPAPAAAEADRGGRGSKRGSREPQASEAAAKLVAAPAAGGGGRGSRHASREPQASEAAAKQAAPPAAGGGRGSQQASREPQASEAAAKQAAAPAAGGGGRGRGGKRASREPQQKHGGAAAAGDAEHFFASGGTSPEKGWQLGADGWWRRALTASACGNTKRGKGNIKLGFPAKLFNKLTGEEPGAAEDLDVVDTKTGEQLRILYRKDLSGGGSNIMGAPLAQWLAEADAQEGDFIALRAAGGGLEVRLMPAGGRGVKRRRWSSEEQEAAAAGSQGGGGSKQQGRAGKGKQPAAAGQAAQRATRAGGAGAAAPQGVESELQGEALLQRRIEVQWSSRRWYAGTVVHYDPNRRHKPYAVQYDDGDFEQESLRPGEWRLLEGDAAEAAEAEAEPQQPQQAQQAQQPAGGRRPAAAAEPEEQAEAEEEWQQQQQQQPPKKRRRLRRLSSIEAEEAQAAAQKQQKQQKQPAPAAASKRWRGGEGAAAAAAAPEPEQAKREQAGMVAEPGHGKQQQAAAAGGVAPMQARPEQPEQQPERQPEPQEQQQPGPPKRKPQRGKPAGKEAALLLAGQDATALLQTSRGRRKAAEVAKAGVQAAFQTEQAGEDAMPAMPPEVPGAVLAAPAAGAAAAQAAEPAEAAAGGPAAPSAAAPTAALARQPSHQRRRASGAAKPRGAAAPPAVAAQPLAATAGAAAEAAAAAAPAARAEALQTCYWFDQRQEPFNRNLPRDARKQETRGQYEKDGLEVTSCHDCQEACYKYPCQSGAGCSKTFCPKCTDLYRYLLAFGPEEPEQYGLRQRFSAGHCPCCLRICLRSKCRQKSLTQLGGEAPMPQDSQSRQIVMAYHLARRLLPAVEQIMFLQQEEARAARTSLQDAQLAQIGYVGRQRAPHSERALCNRCATCLENLHFHCEACDQDICPMCAREARTGRAQAAVKCTGCGHSMQPMRFLDDAQLAMLQQARQRLDAALGGGLSGSISTAAAADPLPRMLWRLCKGHCGCEHERAEWIEPETDWVRQLQRMAAHVARFAPPAPPAPPLPAQQQQQPPSLPAPPAHQRQQTLLQPVPALQQQHAQPRPLQSLQQQLPQLLLSLPPPPPAAQHQQAVAQAVQPASANGPTQAQQLQPSDAQQMLAVLQAQMPDAATQQQQQRMLQKVLLQQWRAAGRQAPGWLASDALWTPAELQQAQQMVRQLFAPRPAAPAQPPQPPLLLAQPPLLLAQPQPPTNSAVGQGVQWQRLVARPLPQQGGGWNARAAMLASASQQAQAQQPATGSASSMAQAAMVQQQEEQQKEPPPPPPLQQQQANGVSLLQPVQDSGLLASEGSAEDGAEARPKRQRKQSRKAQESEAGGGGEAQGQQRHRQQQAQQRPARLQAPAGPQPAPAGQQTVPAAAVPQELSQEEKEERQWWWIPELPEEDVRYASSRGTQDFIWTPHVDQFSPTHKHYQRTIRIFQMLWERGEPIIVRGLRGSMGWTPEAMGRVCKESQSAKLQVIDCSDFSNDHYLMPRDFFERYKLCSGDKLDAAGEPLQMLKLKDFPPTRDFKQVMARHHDDFLQLLNRCLPMYTHPTGGALNLATHLPWYTRLPDLGPKGYIAYGREEEHEGEGDSVTKMHEDLSDAINIMLHVQHRPGAPPSKPRCGFDEAVLPGYSGAGAVWDLVRREDRPALRRFLEDALEGKIEGCPPFVHKGRQLTRADVHDVMHDQCFMLTATHRQLLQRDPYNVHVWHVEQYEHEAVWIPGGCAHQVRNLRSSIKVALDFVSPDAVAECLELRGEFRRGAQKELEVWQAEHGDEPEEDVGSRHYADKLQIGNMVLHGFLHSLSVLESVAAGQFDAIPHFPPPLEEPWRDPEEEGAAAAAAAKPRRQRQRDGGEQEWEEEEGEEAEGEEGRASRGAKRRR